MAERYPGNSGTRPQRERLREDTYSGAGATKSGHVNTVGPENVQECIAEADPYRNGGITKYPMKPAPSGTA